jgi:hypothetical protein
MTYLDKYLEQMDKDNKVGYLEEEWKELSEVDRIAVAVGKLIGQVYNGGYAQFKGNGYGFYLPCLIEKGENELDYTEFVGWLEDIEDAWQIEDYEQMDNLEEQFFQNMAEELEERTIEFIKSEVE